MTTALIKFRRFERTDFVYLRSDWIGSVEDLASGSLLRIGDTGPAIAVSASSDAVVAALRTMDGTMEFYDLSDK